MTSYFVGMNDATETDTKDLVLSIKGLHRILDLVSERGSGGLGTHYIKGVLRVLIDFTVDKIIIAQESLGSFMVELEPKAYHSITKVDFGLLDELTIQPIGVYGSKSKIVEFLKTKVALDDETCMAILTLKSTHADDFM
jgi:hypothetical protein